MGAEELIKKARLASGRTQMDVAWRSGTSRPTLSAYEHGRKSPTLVTVTRILAATGHDLAIEPHVEFTDRPGTDGVFAVPDRLFRVPLSAALATVVLGPPLRPEPGETFVLADRAQRRAVYQILLTKGRPEQIRRHVDGVLLVDLWPELVLPPDIHAAWTPLIEEVTADRRVPT